MNDCWHRAKRPDPEEKRSTGGPSEEEIAMIMRSTPSDCGETDPDETVAEFHGAPPIVPAEFASDGRKALVIAAMAAHIAKRRAD
jgi:hypothetical protein